jgi:site-specific DNA-cytosine methylase
VVEQVPGYLKSEAFATLSAFLSDMGYVVYAKTLDPNHFGMITGRERAVIVATTEPGFEWPKRRGKPPTWQQLVDRGVMLSPEEVPRDLRGSWGGWFTLGEKAIGGIEARPGAYLPRTWKRKKYKPSFVFPETTRIPTIPLGYYSPDPQGPFVWHPDNKSRKPVKGDRYRLLTVGEIRRLHGVPPDYDLGTSVDINGKMTRTRIPVQAEVLGQGVVVPIFKWIFGALPRPRKARRSVANPVAEQREWLLGENPYPVVPLYYGLGPLYSVIPWELIR